MFRRRAPSDDAAAALAEVGGRVCRKLERDPRAYKLPIDGLDIFGVADFFTDEECARLTGMVDAVARPSCTYHGNAAGGRTSYSGDVDPRDPFIRKLEQRIDDLLGIEHAHGEVVQGQRYEPGQQFREHFDYFDTQAEYWPAEVARGGQRTWTAMVYLSDVEAGGATEFPKVALSLPPQKGALLVWNNMGPGGKPNPLTLHAGRPVEQGVKYIVTKWYRARPWC